MNYFEYSAKFTKIYFHVKFLDFVFVDSRLKSKQILLTPEAVLLTHSVKLTHTRSF